MSQHDDGGPAFPARDWDPIARDHYPETGMTLRDYFAAKALPTAWERLAVGRGVSLDEVARRAYAMADAMLKARDE